MWSVAVGEIVPYRSLRKGKQDMIEKK